MSLSMGLYLHKGDLLRSFEEQVRMFGAGKGCGFWDECG